jgi:hypothetical protein
MRERSAILQREMMSWPTAKVGHIFGTGAFRPRKVRFATIPDKRSLERSTAISFRAPRPFSNRTDALPVFSASPVGSGPPSQL